MTTACSVLSAARTSTSHLIVKMGKHEIKLAKVYKTSKANEAKLKFYLQFRETKSDSSTKK